MLKTGQTLRDFSYQPVLSQIRLVDIDGNGASFFLIVFLIIVFNFWIVSALILRSMFYALC